MQKALLNGEEPPQPEGKIEEPNEYFNNWVEKNQERIENAGTLPYWVKDNKKAVEKTMTSTENGSKENGLKAVAEAIGVKAGSPMTHDQADMMHPNPHYKEDKQYRVNCQSTVVAYELRRRGLPIEAFGNVKFSMGETLAHKTQAAWVGSGGKMPTPIICKQEITNRYIDKRGYVRTTYSSVDDVWQDFLKQTSVEGRYHISWNWANKKDGHIITMETFADGTRRFYDPQTGIEDKSILPWIIGKKKIAFDMKKGIRAYRVDNLQPNPLIVQGVVKKAGSTLGTPMMTFEQGLWWLENAQGATSFMGDFEPYSDEILKHLKKCKTKAQRNTLLESVARGTDAKVINDNGKAFTTCYPGHRSMKGETWKNTKQMAIDLNNGGISVCFLPEYKDKISADAIIRHKDNEVWKLTDFKCSKSMKSNTIQLDISHAFEQADCCVIKVLKADKGILCGALDYFARNGGVIKDVIVINEYGKSKFLSVSDIINRKYNKKLKGFL